MKYSLVCLFWSCSLALGKFRPKLKSIGRGKKLIIVDEEVNKAFICLIVLSLSIWRENFQNPKTHFENFAP
jgi:hypothetical protein